jgi:hypothetical protein
MAQRPKKLSEELFRNLRETIKTKGTRLYLIGGLAMAYHGLKFATKDVDVVFLNEEEARSFIEDMKKLGFRSDPAIDVLCGETGGRRFIESGDDRIDIFVIDICRGLSLSEGMMKRSVRIPFFEDIELNVISREDIFLLKGITSRSDDLADMEKLAGRELDWSIIESEIRSQKDSWKWILRLYCRLLDLEGEYGVRSPLIRTFEKEAELYAGIMAVKVRYPEGGIDLEMVAGVLEGDRGFALRVIEEMKKLGLLDSSS